MRECARVRSRSRNGHRAGGEGLETARLHNHFGAAEPGAFRQPGSNARTSAASAGQSSCRYCSLIRTGWRTSFTEDHSAAESWCESIDEYFSLDYVAPWSELDRFAQNDLDKWPRGLIFLLAMKVHVGFSLALWACAFGHGTAPTGATSATVQAAPGSSTASLKVTS
jgi:hypothetical protein